MEEEFGVSEDLKIFGGITGLGSSLLSVMSKLTIEKIEKC
jgi:hypothetical protein